MPFKDKDVEKEWRRKWELKNRDKRRETNKQYSRRRKAKVLKLLGTKCNCCGIKEFWNLTVDHIIPQDKTRIISQVVHVGILNGKEDLSQFQILCFGCNLSKGRYKKCKINHKTCDP